MRITLRLGTSSRIRLVVRNVIRATAAGLLAAAVVAPDAWAQNRDAAIAFVGGTIIDGNGGRPITDGVLVVVGEHITAVGPRAEVQIPRGARRVDATGKFLTPGFVDTNVHVSLYSGIETLARYQPQFTDLVIEHAQLHLKHGITTLRDSYGMLGPLIEARDAMASGKVEGPRLLVAGNIVGWGGPWSFTWSGNRPQNLSLFGAYLQGALAPSASDLRCAMGCQGFRVAQQGDISIRVSRGHFYPCLTTFTSRLETGRGLG